MNGCAGADVDVEDGCVGGGADVVDGCGDGDDDGAPHGHYWSSQCYHQFPLEQSHLVRHLGDDGDHAAEYGVGGDAGASAVHAHVLYFLLDCVPHLKNCSHLHHSYDSSCAGLGYLAGQILIRSNYICTHYHSDGYVHGQLNDCYVQRPFHNIHTCKVSLLYVSLHAQLSHMHARMFFHNSHTCVPYHLCEI